MVELSQFLKLFITFKIFDVFNIVSIYNKRMIEGVTVRLVLEACVLKPSIFVVQKLVLHENMIEFFQQSIGDIRISLATL